MTYNDGVNVSSDQRVSIYVNTDASDLVTVEVSDTDASDAEITLELTDTQTEALIAKLATALAVRRMARSAD